MNATISKIKFILLAFAALSVVHCSKGGGDGSGATATSVTCPANQLYTTGAGCLPQCGAASVYYNGQCVAAAAVTGGYNQSCTPTMQNGQYNCSTIPGGIGGIGGIGGQVGGQGNPAVCGGSCGNGQVQSIINGTVACLPQGACGTCFGQNNGYCYAGVNACMYYYGQPGTSCLSAPIQ